MFITAEYDIAHAITNVLELDSLVEVLDHEHLTLNAVLANTTAGKFVCESFSDSKHQVWMKVYPVKEAFTNAD